MKVVFECTCGESMTLPVEDVWADRCWGPSYDGEPNPLTMLKIAIPNGLMFRDTNTRAHYYCSKCTAGKKGGL